MEIFSAYGTSKKVYKTPLKTTNLGYDILSKLSNISWTAVLVYYETRIL